MDEADAVGRLAEAEAEAMRRMRIMDEAEAVDWRAEAEAEAPRRMWMPLPMPMRQPLPMHHAPIEMIEMMMHHAPIAIPRLGGMLAVREEDRRATEDPRGDEGREPAASDEATGLASTLERRVFSVRENDPSTNHLYIGTGLDPRAWKQLGRWLRSNTHVAYACFQSCGLRGRSMEDLCAGLRHNASVTEFELGDVRLGKAEIGCLGPFIGSNPSLRTLNIEGCMGGKGMDLLASALASRARSLENVSLDGNGLGTENVKEEFDALVAALTKNGELRRLSLTGNQLGTHAATSLSRLLRNPASKVKSIVLRNNYLDDECADVLAGSLTNNAMLNNIDLDQNGRMSAKGLMRFLDLVCCTPRAAVELGLQWNCPRSHGAKRVDVKMKLNEPMKNLAAYLYAEPEFKESFDWVPGTTMELKTVNSFQPLDLSETPFFNGLKDGSLIDVVVRSGGGRPSGRLTISMPPTEPLQQRCEQLQQQQRGTGNAILNTCSSNHHLSSIGYETATRLTKSMIYPNGRDFNHMNILREFLEANKNEDKRSTIRRKVFRCHVQYALSLEDLCETTDAVMPRVLAWIGVALAEAGRDRAHASRSPIRLETFYRIIRAMPMLCGS